MGPGLPGTGSQSGYRMAQSAGAGCGGGAPAEDLGLGRDPAQVRDAEQRQDQHHRGRHEGDDGADEHDLPHLPEPVGVQQQAAQGLTPEDGLHLRRQRGVLRLGQRCRGQLRVRLAAADLPQVDGDEVVGVGLGLRAGGHLLAGVGGHGRGVGGGQGLDGRAARGREIDLLGSELGVHLVAHEIVSPQQQPTRHREDHSEDQPADDGQQVKSLAAHLNASLFGGQAR